MKMRVYGPHGLYEDDNAERAYARQSYWLGYESRPVDLEGRPVERTKQSHPYSYDGFVLWRKGSNKNITGAVYTDRLAQWDARKFARLCNEFLPEHGWSNANPRAVERFLQAWNEDPKLRLIAIMEWCNAATGYPTWSLHYKSGEERTTLKVQMPKDEMFCHRGVDGAFSRFHLSAMGVRMHEVPSEEIVRVRLVPDPEGTHWCWHSFEEDRYSLCFQHIMLLNMCFPYGPEVEEKTEKGLRTRVRVELLEENAIDR